MEKRKCRKKLAETVKSSSRLDVLVSSPARRRRTPTSTRPHPPRRFGARACGLLVNRVAHVPRLLALPCRVTHAFLCVLLCSQVAVPAGDSLLQQALSRRPVPRPGPGADPAGRGARLGDWAREAEHHAAVHAAPRLLLAQPQTGANCYSFVNPFTPKSDPFQIPPAASPEI